MSLLFSRSASCRLILEQLPQGDFELLLDLGNGVFMPDSEDRFFAELLRVVNTAQQQMSVADVSKVIQQAESSKSDPVTTAVNLFNGLGTNATVSGSTLRTALSNNGVSVTGNNGKLLNNIESISKSGNNVTITNRRKLTAGYVSEQKQVSFSVGTLNGRAAITNIRGVSAGVGFFKFGVHSVEVASVSGQTATLKIRYDGTTITHTIGGP
jgi:hypothetical protein